MIDKELEYIQELLNHSEESNVILGITLAKSVLGWGYREIFDKIGEAFHKTIIDNADQEEICRMCEEDILGCSRMSVHFMCEGCSCEEANDIIIENYLEQTIDDIL